MKDVEEDEGESLNEEERRGKSDGDKENGTSRSTHDWDSVQPVEESLVRDQRTSPSVE